MKTYFIASGTSAELEEYIISFAADGINIFFTGPSADDAYVLEKKISEKGAYAYYYPLKEGYGFPDLADAVISCAEKLGGIDVLLFGGWFRCETELFLDISEKDFSSYTNMLVDFFCLCKCALPYMLGRSDAEIMLPVEEYPHLNIGRAMYRSACMAMIKNMAHEFKSYGVEVRSIPLHVKYNSMS
jgi:hypothetical protein